MKDNHRQYITSKEAASKWNISESIVHKYCTQSRMKDAYFEQGIWYILDNTPKPRREKKKVIEVPLPPLVSVMLIPSSL